MVLIYWHSEDLDGEHRDSEGGNRGVRGILNDV